MSSGHILTCVFLLWRAVRAVDTARRKRRSHGSFLPTRAVSRVEVWPEEGQSLGLSIVGGRHVIKRLKNGEELKGIFIKQVLPNSPAAKTRSLKTGDKILEVGSTPSAPAPRPPLELCFLRLSEGLMPSEARSEPPLCPSGVGGGPASGQPRGGGLRHQPMSLTASSFRPKVKRTASPGRGAVSPAGGSTSSAQSGFQKPAVAPPPLKQPPPYRPPVQSEQELVSDLDQVRVWNQDHVGGFPVWNRDHVGGFPAWNRVRVDGFPVWNRDHVDEFPVWNRVRVDEFPVWNRDHVDGFPVWNRDHVDGFPVWNRAWFEPPPSRPDLCLWSFFVPGFPGFLAASASSAFLVLRCSQVFLVLRCSQVFLVLRGSQVYLVLRCSQVFLVLNGIPDPQVFLVLRCSQVFLVLRCSQVFLVLRGSQMFLVFSHQVSRGRLSVLRLGGGGGGSAFPHLLQSFALNSRLAGSDSPASASLPLIRNQRPAYLMSLRSLVKGQDLNLSSAGSVMQIFVRTDGLLGSSQSERVEEGFLGRTLRLETLAGQEQAPRGGEQEEEGQPGGKQILMDSEGWSREGGGSLTASIAAAG
ncbi:unnamed protein product [Menidia menidia]|uniref:(Atlantic silverside) hypothetical protein n=1 Tax=Menidia menidia TaxID=238744 RepID=A0A8S4AFN6_9TELE|nr:unnamed protein product [Menidia menidia]